MAYSEDQDFDDLLDAMTQAMLTDQDDVKTILKRYQSQGAKVTGFMPLIRDLYQTLSVQDPSDKFMQDLKKDLMGQSHGMGARLRSLPARVQLAAGGAVVAGFMFISWRRFLPTAQNRQEIPALRQSSS